MVESSRRNCLRGGECLAYACMRRRYPVRPEDALRHLSRALAAPPNSNLRQSQLEQALLVYSFGITNQEHFGERGDRRHGRGRHDATEAKALMKQISEATGELRPYALARLAVRSGKLGKLHAEEDSVIRRLARYYRQLK